MKLTRRKLLTLFGAVGATATVNRYGPTYLINNGRDMGMCDVPERRNFGNADQFLSRPRVDFPNPLSLVYGQRQYTLIGDSNHIDLRLPAFFYSDQNVNDMYEAGIKHLCVEIVKSEQDLIDRIQSGAISEDEYMDLHSTDSNIYREYKARPFYKGVRQLGQLGIKVHCIDTEEDLDTLHPRSLQFFGGLTSLHRRMCQTPNGVITNQTFASHMLLNPIKALTAFMDVGGQDNSELGIARGDDRDRVARITELTGGEPTVILFGDGHFDNQTNSIRSLLGNLAVHVATFAEKNQFEMDRYSTPDFLYFIQEEQMYNWSNNNFNLSSQPRNTP